MTEYVGPTKTRERRAAMISYIGLVTLGSEADSETKDAILEQAFDDERLETDDIVRLLVVHAQARVRDVHYLRQSSLLGE